MRTDRRTAYTKKAIKEALFALLEENRLDEITVKEICARADINRATFYRNYPDIYALFEAVERELIEQAHLDTSKGLLLTQFLQVIYHNQAFYREEFLRQKASSFSIQINEYLKKELLAEQKRHAAASGADLPDDDFYDISFQYMVHGVTGILKDWTLSGCKQPPEVLGPILSKIVHRQLL